MTPSPNPMETSKPGPPQPFRPAAHKLATLSQNATLYALACVVAEPLRVRCLCRWLQRRPSCLRAGTLVMILAILRKSCLYLHQSKRTSRAPSWISFCHGGKALMKPNPGCSPANACPTQICSSANSNIWLARKLPRRVTRSRISYPHGNCKFLSLDVLANENVV